MAATYHLISATSCPHLRSYPLPRQCTRCVAQLAQLLGRPTIDVRLFAGSHRVPLRMTLFLLAWYLILFVPAHNRHLSHPQPQSLRCSLAFQQQSIMSKCPKAVRCLVSFLLHQGCGEHTRNDVSLRLSSAVLERASILPSERGLPAPRSSL